MTPEYPCTWPTFPRFQIIAQDRIGPLGAYNSEVLIIDGNTGTQLDVPPHSVTPPDSGFSNAGAFGRAYTDVVPAWQFGGEACVIDGRDLMDGPAPGRSHLIGADRVRAWERSHRPLGAGDAVLFASGYTDRFYRPMPAGRRFAADPVEGKAPAWPGPDPACMEYLAGRKVMTLGIDSTSMGPLPDLAEPTHFAGLKHGMIWAESLIGLGQLPATGAFYVMLGPKYAGGIYSELRAFAVVGDPLARRLIDSARKKNAVDLSVVLSDDRPVTWPGRGVGNHRQPLMTIRWGINPNTRTPFEMHMLDSQAGTHLVPPAYALPPEGFDDATYPPEVKTLAGRVRGEVRPPRHQRHDDREGAALPDLRPGAGHRRARTCSAPRPARTGRTHRRSPPTTSGATRRNMGRCVRVTSSSSAADGATASIARSRRARPAWMTRSTAGAKAGRRRDPMPSCTWQAGGSDASPPTRRPWAASSPGGPC